MYFQANFNIQLILLYIVLAILIVVFLFSVGLYIWRLYANRKEKKEDQLRACLLNEILAYLNGEVNKQEINNHLQKQSKKVPILVSICMELNRSLKGESENKVAELLNLPLVIKSFRKKLYSKEISKISFALSFYRYIRLPKNVIKRIEELLEHKNDSIAFAAGLALAQSNKGTVQAKAIRKLSMRHGVSQLAFLELLIAFTQSYKSEKKRGIYLMKLITNEYLSLESRYVVVKELGECKYYQQGTELHKHFCKILSESNKIGNKYLGAIVETLGKLQSPVILPYIEKFISNNKSTRLKVDCAKALGELGGEKSILLLNKLLEDYNEQVQKEAAQQLLRIGDDALLFLPGDEQKEYSSIRQDTLREIKEAKAYRHV